MNEQEFNGLLYAARIADDQLNRYAPTDSRRPAALKAKERADERLKLAYEQMRLTKGESDAIA